MIRLVLVCFTILFSIQLSLPTPSVLKSGMQLTGDSSLYSENLRLETSPVFALTIETENFLLEILEAEFSLSTSKMGQKWRSSKSTTKMSPPSITGVRRTPSYPQVGTAWSDCMMIRLLTQKVEWGMRCPNIRRVSTLFISSLLTHSARLAQMMAKSLFTTMAVIGKKVFWHETQKMGAIRQRWKSANSWTLITFSSPQILTECWTSTLFTPLTTETPFFVL